MELTEIKTEDMDWIQLGVMEGVCKLSNGLSD
jgi:hypothetical protein